MDISRDVFVSTNQAYLVMPPSSVAPDVQELSWSPRGRTLLFTSIEKEPEVEYLIGQLEQRPVTLRVPEAKVGIYAPQSNRVRWASGLPANAMPHELDWISETSALVEAMRVDLVDGVPSNQRAELFHLNTGTGRLTPVGTANTEAGQRLAVVAEPSLGMALVFIKDLSGPNIPTAGECFVISENGQAVPAPTAVREAVAQGWHPGEPVPGKGIVFAQYTAAGPSFRLLNSRMVFEPWNENGARREDTAAPPAVLVRSPGTIGDNLLLMPSVRAAANEPGSSPVTVCQQVEQSVLSPSFLHVAYTSQRMLWVRAIQPIDREIYLRALEAKRRTEAMMKAKQVGTALMIFAADNDDLFPTGDPAAALAPYLRNADLLKDFVFTLPNAKSLLDVKNPAETEIGYIPIPGGRVVAYADSHVKFVPDK